MNQVIENLLIHPNTSGQLEAFYNHPANALLITGRPGSGKAAIAHHLTARLLDVTPDKLLSHPQFMLIEKPVDKSEIPIDSIRQLISKTSLRVPTRQAGEGSINRVALLEDAGLMSTEAQNALLKLLEEPPAGTLLILTADSTDSLLPTIVSRVQTIRIIPPSLEQSVEYFKEHHQPAVASAWELSQGGPGLLSALLSQQDSHPLKAGVADAKTFLGMPPYQRIITLQELSKDKARFSGFLEALARVLSALHAQSIRSNRQKNAADLLTARQAVEEALTQNKLNANQRLTYLALVLNIPL